LIQKNPLNLFTKIKIIINFHLNMEVNRSITTKTFLNSIINKINSRDTILEFCQKNGNINFKLDFYWPKFPAWNSEFFYLFAKKKKKVIIKINFKKIKLMKLNEFTILILPNSKIAEDLEKSKILKYVKTQPFLN